MSGKARSFTMFIDLQVKIDFLLPSLQFSIVIANLN